MHEHTVAEDFKVQIAHDVVRKLEQINPFLDYLIKTFKAILDDTVNLSLCVHMMNETSIWHPYKNVLTEDMTYAVRNITLTKELVKDAKSIHLDLTSHVEYDDKLHDIETWKGGVKDKSFIGKYVCNKQELIYVLHFTY